MGQGATGAASGATMSKGQQAFAGAGASMFQAGTAENDQMLNKLAAMGPPPEVQLPQQGAGMPSVGGTGVTGQYQQMMTGVAKKKPTMTRGEAVTNPNSIGGLLAMG